MCVKFERCNFFALVNSSLLLIEVNKKTIRMFLKDSKHALGSPVEWMVMQKRFPMEKYIMSGKQLRISSYNKRRLDQF